MPAKHIYYNPEFHDRKRWVENLSDGLRVRPAHEILNLRHTGWFADLFQEATIHGAVVYLSHGRCVAAYSDAWNPDCYVVDFGSIGDDDRDVAYWADSMAQHAAEAERGFQEAENHRIALEEAKDELARLRLLDSDDILEIGQRTVAAQIEKLEAFLLDAEG